MPSVDEIIKEMISKSQFYKICSIKADNPILASAALSVVDLGYNVLNNLTEQEQLQVDDYFGWTKIVANKMYSYNNRLNIFDLKRRAFDGFSNFANSPWKDTGKYNFLYWTHIVSDKMDAWVRSGDDNTNVEEGY